MNVDYSALVEVVPLPAGYRLEVAPQRKYKYRSLWAVRVFKDGERVWGKAFYNLALGLIEGEHAAWRLSRETV